MALDPSLLTRRRFLLASGAAAGGLLLGACGDDDEPEVETDAEPTTDGDAGYSLLGFLPAGVLGTTIESRIPFGVADRDGILPPEDVPETLDLEILDADGRPVGGPITVRRHAEGLARAYYPLRTTFDVPGTYELVTEIEGQDARLAVQVQAQDELRLVRSGVRMPSIESPTTDDPRGVTPICTRDPVCPLHDVTVSEVLQEGRPLALLVATPAFCQVTICGPVLDLLLEVKDRHPAFAFLHAEVYADPATSLTRFSPTVEQLLIPHEPVLVLVAVDGTVHDRVDVIFDRDELDETLARYAPG